MILIFSVIFLVLKLKQPIFNCLCVNYTCTLQFICVGFKNIDLCVHISNKYKTYPVDEFYAYAQKKPEYAKLFHVYQELHTAKQKAETATEGGSFGSDIYLRRLVSYLRIAFSLYNIILFMSLYYVIH